MPAEPAAQSLRLDLSPLSAMFAMMIAIACMTWLNLYAAPAIALAILPYATVEASWLYPIDVGVSVAVLAIVFRISSLRTSRSL